MDLTIVTWLWRGWNPVYGPEDVYALRDALEEHMSIPFRFVCATDGSYTLDCETVLIPPIEVEEDPERYTGSLLKPNCYHRLRLFDPAVGWTLGEYVLSIDLDTRIFDDLAPMLGRGHLFKIMEGSERAPYCGTMFLLKTGHFRRVWDSFDPVETPRILARTKYRGEPIVGSDQAWMSVQLPNQPTWKRDGSDGAYLLRDLMWRPGYLKGRQQPPDNVRVVFCPGRLKFGDDPVRMVVPWIK